MLLSSLLCVLWLAVSSSSSTSSLVRVVRGQEGLEVLEGWQEGLEGWQKDTQWLARGNLTDVQAETGWLHLSVESNPGASNMDQAEAAGMVEGHLTRDIIHQYYMDFIHRDLCGVSRDFCDWMIERLKWQQKQERPEEPYWEMVGLFYSQLKGLRAGWLARTSKDGFVPAPEFDSRWFGHMINFLPDISDYIQHYTEHLRQEQALATRTGFAEPPLSYAGSLYSLDDFYLISSGLTVTESTLFIYNKTLYRDMPYGQKVASTVWEPIRVMVANRLAAIGQDWGQVFSRYNSGTYNNQWMVVSGSGSLWVTEQLPGRVETREETGHLRREGYWASYNRAAFPEIQALSGAKDMVEKYGDWFSHKATPRALLFYRGQGEVTSPASMLQLLRSNSFPSSPLSRVPGCTGELPQAELAARGDLQEEGVTCTWQADDFMVGRRAYGAIDAKAALAPLASSPSLSFLAVAGPTQGVTKSTQGSSSISFGPPPSPSLPPFSWSSVTFPSPLFSTIDIFNFSPVTISWTSPATSSSPVTKPTSTPASTTSTTTTISPTSPSSSSTSILPSSVTRLLGLFQVMVCYLFSSYCAQ